MSIARADDALAALTALLRRYVRGEVLVAEMVAAYSSLPAGTTGDFALSLDGVEPDVAEARLAALAQALGPPRGDA